MPSKHPRQFLTGINLETIKTFIFLAIIVWVAHFWHSANFGLYEDDYYFITPAMRMTGAQLWRIFWDSGWKFQGTPLKLGLPYLFSFIGWKLGGLKAIYWIGYAIVTFNAFLFYTLLKRVSTQVIALTSALSFCLFPADTTQAFLMHALGLQPSLTFLLIAYHCYLSEKRTLSYLFILASLMTYETTYLVFLAAPLFKEQWNSRLVKEVFKHVLILGSMLAIVFIFRGFSGENRVAGLELQETIYTSVKQMLIGPVVSLEMFAYRPIQVLLALDGKLMVSIILSFALIVWIMLQLKLDTYHFLRANSNKIPHLMEATSMSHEKLLMLVFIGLIMLILAYPLTFTVPAHKISGRATRVHLTAVVGASILSGCMCSIILYVAKNYGKKRLGLLSLTVFFSLLVGFGFLVQRDYQASWESQQMFWTEFIQLASDIDGNTVVLVQTEELPRTGQIQAFAWSLPLVLNHIYEFPANWHNRRQVFRLRSTWQENIVTDNLSLEINYAVVSGPSKLQLSVESRNIIVLTMENGKLMRRSEPLIIHDKKFPLKEISTPTITSFEKGPLFDYLIQTTN